MKIKLITIGKTDKNYLIEGIKEYQNRLKHYINFQFIIIQDIKNTKKLNPETQKKLEGNLILKNIEKSDFLILLDENGKQYSSVNFAKFIEKQMITSQKSLVFVIGGPYGFSDEVYEKANQKISLSLMTFSHQIIRLIFIEQLYRAFTIIKGEPYHHL